MTTSYLGMNSHTGLSISEVEHIRQSVRDILVTPVGSRVMRREYGSLLSALEDHRGTTVYDISTGQPVVIEKLGALPDNVVSVAPDGEYVKWDGAKWVHDAEAEKTFLQGQAAQEKANLLIIATSAIAPPCRMLLIWIWQRKTKPRVYPHGKSIA